MPPLLRDRPAAWTAIVALGGVFGLHRLIDPDLFQQIAVGRAILADPRSLGVSRFIEAYPDHPYVEDKWLPSVLVALFDRLGGPDGVMLYQIAICIGVAAAWYAMQRAWGASRAAAILGVVLGLLTCTFRLEPRPDTLSHALLAIAIALVARSMTRTRALGSVAALFVLWINVHGYFVNGLLVLLAAEAAATLGDARLTAPRAGLAPRDRWIALAVAVAACLVHPQGVAALASPMQQLLLVGDPVVRAGIQELLPATGLFAGAGPWQWLCLGGTFAAALVAGAATTSDPPGRRHALAAGAAAVWLVWPPPAMDALAFRVSMALWIMTIVELPALMRARRLFEPLLVLGFTILVVPAVRNLPMLTPASLIVLAPVWTVLEAALPERPAARRAAVAALVAVLGGTAWLRLSDRMNAAIVRAPTRTGWGVDADRFPVGAADFVATRDLPGPLLNGFDAGGYLLYRLHPQRRVFIAGNTSMYPASFFADYRANVVGPSLDLAALGARFGVQTVVWDLASSVAARLFGRLAADPAWRLVFLDRGGVVFTRATDRPDLPPIDLTRRVTELAAEDATRPALPRALGGRSLAFPGANLAAFLSAIGRPDLALRAAEPLWAHAPSESLADAMAGAAQQGGTLRQRLAWLLAAQERYPTSEALRSLAFMTLAPEADALLQGGRLDAAESHLVRMRDLQPAACGPRLGLAKIAALRGDATAARSHLGDAFRLDGDGTCGGAQRAIRRSRRSDRHQDDAMTSGGRRSPPQCR